jgi:hypothetical protein
LETKIEIVSTIITVDEERLLLRCIVRDISLKTLKVSLESLAI